MFCFTSFGRMVLCLRECLGAMASFTTESTQTGLSEGADRIGGQLRGGKECHFSGVTRSGRVWSKVPESDARSVSPSVVWCETRDAVVTQRTGPGSPTSAVDLDERFLP